MEARQQDRVHEIFEGRLGTDIVEDLSPDELSDLREKTGKAIARLGLFLNVIMMERGELTNNHPGAPKGDPNNPELLESRQNIGSEITRLWLVLNAVMSVNGELTRGHIKGGAGLAPDQIHFID